MTVVIEGASSGIWNSPIISALIAALISVIGTYLLNKKMMSDEAIKNKKRMCYSDFLAEFTARITNNEKDKKDLIYAYEIMKLWASENVLILIVDALETIKGESIEVLKIKKEYDDGVIAEEQYKEKLENIKLEKYHKVVEVMRKDLGVNTGEINDKTISLIN